MNSYPWVTIVLTWTHVNQREEHVWQYRCQSLLDWGDPWHYLVLTELSICQYGRRDPPDVCTTWRCSWNRKAKVALTGNIYVSGSLCNLIGGGTWERGSKCMCNLRAWAPSLYYKTVYGLLLFSLSFCRIWLIFLSIEDLLQILLFSSSTKVMSPPLLGFSNANSFTLKLN